MSSIDLDAVVDLDSPLYDLDGHPVVGPIPTPGHKRPHRRVEANVMWPPKKPRIPEPRLVFVRPTPEKFVDVPEGWEDDEEIALLLLL